MSRRAPRGRSGRWPSAPSGASGGTNTVRAVVLLVVAVAVAVGILSQIHSPRGTRTAGTATTTTTARRDDTGSSTTTTTVPLLAPSKVTVQVLNGLISGSLSSEWSAKLKDTYGYQTLPPNNVTRADTADTIYIVKAGFLPEAQVLAHQLALPTSVIVPSVPPPASAPIPATVLHQADLVLVVGQGLASKA